MTFRTRRSGTTAAVAVAATILLGMPARADEPQPAKEDTGAAESAGPAQPAGTPPEQVQVEGKLPYVPTSNTIATRLPVPLRLTMRAPKNPFHNKG